MVALGKVSKAKHIRVLFGRLIYIYVTITLKIVGSFSNNYRRVGPTLPKVGRLK